MLSFFKITCEEAHQICNKSQYKEASFKELLRLRFHLLICKVCALYAKHNGTLTRLLKGRSIDCKQEKHTLNKEFKDSLREKIKNERLSL